MATSPKQRLALAICDFLSKSLADGTLSSEDSDDIEVAINGIATSFKVDPADADAVSKAVGSRTLLQIFADAEAQAPAAAAAASSAAGPDPGKGAAPTDAQKKEAEALKSRGNAAMAQKDYAGAVDLYSQALALDPGNAIFLSNRAAAYSAARDHESAQADAEAAVAVDPKYTKAWSRLGLARFALGDPRGSMEAYAKGIEHEGSGGSEAMRKGFETARRRVEEQEADEVAARGSPASPGGGPGGGLPDLSGLASMLGGGGGPGGPGAGAGGGGMPDLSSIMSNPMFASMAQNLMSNPDLMNNLMSNPRLKEMAERFGSGGGMPDLGALMSDPSIAEMARNMMGGGAGRGAPGGGAAGSGGH